MKKLILSLAAVTMLSGCAAMFNGTTDTIHVSSGIRDAEIYINNQLRGEGAISFEHKKSDLGETLITVKKDGCKDVQVTVEGDFDPVTLLGVLIDFGLISVLVVDGAATGAWQEASNTFYQLTPVCK